MQDPAQCSQVPASCLPLRVSGWFRVHVRFYFSKEQQEWILQQWDRKKMEKRDCMCSSCLHTWLHVAVCCIHDRRQWYFGAHTCACQYLHAGTCPCSPRAGEHRILARVMPRQSVPGGLHTRVHAHGVGTARFNRLGSVPLSAPALPPGKKPHLRSYPVNTSLL